MRNTFRRGEAGSQQRSVSRNDAAENIRDKRSRRRSHDLIVYNPQLRSFARDSRYRTQKVPAFRRIDPGRADDQAGPPAACTALAASCCPVTERGRSDPSRASGAAAAIVRSRSTAAMNGTPRLARATHRRDFGADGEGQVALVLGAIDIGIRCRIDDQVRCQWSSVRDQGWLRQINGLSIGGEHAAETAKTMYQRASDLATDACHEDTHRSGLVERQINHVRQHGRGGVAL